MKKIFLILFCLYLFLTSMLFSADIYNKKNNYNDGDLNINTNLEFQYITHRTNDGWLATSDYKYKKTNGDKDSKWEDKINKL